MDYKLHTQQRYLERFRKTLSDNQYQVLCELTKSAGWSIRPDKRRVFKTIVEYDNRLMWCIFNRKNTVFTVYPFKNKHKNNIYEISSSRIKRF